MNSQTTRWTIVVENELDRTLRRFLADRGGKKGDISAFVTQAVSRMLLREAMQASWSRNKTITETDALEFERLIEDEMKAVRQQKYEKQILA
jgi:Arc/MetJ-type ribon-helix-helix transcriptional regulator